MPSGLNVERRIPGGIKWTANPTGVPRPAQRQGGASNAVGSRPRKPGHRVTRSLISRRSRRKGSKHYGQSRTPRSLIARRTNPSRRSAQKKPSARHTTDRRRCANPKRQTSYETTTYQTRTAQDGRAAGHAAAARIDGTRGGRSLCPIPRPLLPPAPRRLPASIYRIYRALLTRATLCRRTLAPHTFRSRSQGLPELGKSTIVPPKKKHAGIRDTEVQEREE